MKLKKCFKCGSVINIMTDCKCEDCGFVCCDEIMSTVKENSVDASFEKHIPTYKINGDKMIVEVNHVMDKDHYIEWISMVYQNKEEIYYLNPNNETRVEFDYKKGAIIYSYCNKHGLWKNTVD